MSTIEERLQRLKSTTETAIGEPLTFSPQRMQNVRAFMCKEELQQSILTLLTQPKCSSDVTQLLHAKNEQLIVHNEGFILTLLHELEASGFVQSVTDEHNVKRYILTKKGSKALAEERQREPLIQLDKLWQEVRGQ